MFRAISMVIKCATFFVLCCAIVIQAKKFDDVVQPYTINMVTQRDRSLDVYKDIERKLRQLKTPKNKIPEISHAIKLASTESGIGHNWILAIMYTEAPEFKYNTTSSKGYKGLMGTPGNKTTGEYPDVDTLHGIHILEEKLAETNGNMMDALTLYKGGNNPAARKCAERTYAVYRKLVNS
jgi:hypothetical protein